MNKRLTKIIYTSMFAALTCIATMIIKVPTVGTNGYVNIGDSLVLTSAWILGNPFGAIAAGLGSGLADLLSGYASYVPGTAIIKFLMAFLATIIYKLLQKINVPKIVTYIISGIVAEVIMVAGYLLYEATLLGYGVGAVASVPSNIVQGLTCLVLGVLLIVALTKIPFINSVIRED